MAPLCGRVRVARRHRGHNRAISPHQLDLAQVDAKLVSGFLSYLQTVRGNSVTTRNARLASIHSFYDYAALRHP